MFKKLFHYPRVISRHANAPLAKERITFLSHIALRGTPDSTLLRYATQLRVISIRLGNQIPGPITPQVISQCAQRWARRQRRQGRAQSLKWPRERFRHVASAWCCFMGWLKDKPAPPLAYATQLQVWAEFLRSEAHLAEGTVSGYCWWIRIFLQWLQRKRLLFAPTDTSRNRSVYSTPGLQKSKPGQFGQSSKGSAAFLALRFCSGMVPP